MIDSIGKIIADFLKPRSVCICGDFSPVKRDPFQAWTKCSCGGWMSDLMQLARSTREGL